MRRFFGSVKGNGKMVTRTGTALSGIECNVFGENTGVRVNVYVDDDGLDHIEVWKTGGRRGYLRNVLIAEFDSEI